MRLLLLLNEEAEMWFTGKLRRNKRGIGSVIGAVFMVLILLSGYMFYTFNIDVAKDYADILEDMQQLDLRRNKENIEFISVSIVGNQLNMTIQNTGPFQAHLIWLGIFDENVIPARQEYHELDIYVEPAETVSNILEDGITLPIGQECVIQLVTELGNIFNYNYPPREEDSERAHITITGINGTATYNPSQWTLLESTQNVSGSVSDLTSNDGNYVIFRSYYSGTSTDINDFVDNNASDEDFSADKGTHGNFSAEQAGPDSNFDTLTEQNTETILFQQVTVASQQTTSNTAWTDVPGATISFTPSSASEKWLVLVTADIRSSSTSENRARFRYIVNGVAIGETGVQQGTTSTNPIDPYNVYFHFNMVTGVTSQQTVTFQFQANAGSTAYARNINILCIRLDSADLQYAEVNGDTQITGPQTLATLQFTPSSAGDYIVAYCALVSGLPTTPGGAETWLDFDSGTGLYPDPWTTPNTRRIHADATQYEPHGLFAKVSLDAAQHTFRAQAQLRIAGNPATARDLRIAAFRVDAFDLLEFDEDTAVASTTGANTVRSVVTTQNPGEQRDYLILAGIHTISSGTSSREAGGIEIDDVFVQRKGDRRLSTQIARIASHYAYVKTGSTSFNVETTYGRGGIGSNTIYSKQSVIYVLKIPRNYELDLEVQWTDVDYDEANEDLCIYAGTIGSEDVQVDVWYGSSWQNLLPSLSSGWNNVSVSPYLVSSTFTIRFKDKTDIGDATRDSWEIDAALLHVWAEPNEYTAEAEFTGSSNLEDWTKLNWQMDSSWDIGEVTVTIQFYNYTLGDYASSGNGYINYLSSSIPNTDELESQTITVNPMDFRNESTTGGEWKVKITGAKPTSTQFLMKIDWVELNVTYSSSGDSISYGAWQWYTITASAADGDPIPYAYISIYANGTDVSFRNATSKEMRSNPDWVRLNANGEYYLEIRSASESEETFTLYAVAGSVVAKKTISQEAPE